LVGVAATARLTSESGGGGSASVVGGGKWKGTGKWRRERGIYSRARGGVVCAPRRPATPAGEVTGGAWEAARMVPGQGTARWAWRGAVRAGWVPSRGPGPKTDLNSNNDKTTLPNSKIHQIL
jgi:hypothetical protein